MHTPDTLGAPELGPFDRIIVSAAAQRIPSALVSQLAEGGVLIMPARERELDTYLWKVRKENGKVMRKRLLPVSFVPLK